MDFKCIKCNVKFASQYHLDRHEKNIKPCVREECQKYLDSKKTCLLCSRKFANTVALKNHIDKNVCTKKANKREKINGPVSESDSESTIVSEHETDDEIDTEEPLKTQVVIPVKQSIDEMTERLNKVTAQLKERKLEIEIIKKRKSAKIT